MFSVAVREEQTRDTDGLPSSASFAKMQVVFGANKSRSSCQCAHTTTSASFFGVISLVSAKGKPAFQIIFTTLRLITRKIYTREIICSYLFLLPLISFRSEFVYSLFIPSRSAHLFDHFSRNAVNPTRRERRRRKYRHQLFRKNSATRRSIFRVG